VRNAESRFAGSAQAAVAAERRLAFGVVAVLLAAVFLAFGTSRASAAYTHVANLEFGSDGGNTTNFGGEFGGVNSLALQQASKRLYVGTSNQLYGIDISTPGTFTPILGFPRSNTLYQEGTIGVDNSVTASAGNIYSGPSEITSFYGYNSSGAVLPGWPVTTPVPGCGAGSDSEGHVWAALQFGNTAAVEFNPTGGASIGSFARNPSSGGSCRIAIDSTNDDIYLSRTSSVTAGVYRYTKASNYATSEKLVNITNPKAPIALNGVSHRLYFGSESSNEIKALDTTTGNVVETFSVAGNVKDIAVDEGNDTVYALLLGTRRVQEARAFGGPKATTTGQTNPNLTAVTGVADPNGNGPITQCYFEFAKSGSASSKQNCDQPLPINFSQAVSATLPGVEGEHLYSYRLVVANAEPGGVAAGIKKSFLLHNVVGLTNDQASELKRNSAKFNAHFEGENDETTYYFEYGETTAYGSRYPTGTGELSAGITSGNTPISAVVSGLDPQTKYHYRVVAKNSKGTSVSSGDIEFETPPAVGSISTDQVTEVTQTTATLNGSYNASTSDTISDPPENYFYYFEWGTSTAYGNTTAAPPGVDAGIHNGIHSVSAPITGLTKYTPATPTPYHYRIVVSNGYGTTYGQDRIFHSAPADPPGIGEVAAGGVTPTEASVSANVNPNGAPTTFVVEYGADSSYGSSTVESTSIGEEEEAHSVGATLEGLSPGTTYHYRVVASNFGGTSHSADQTFTTPDVPGIGSSSVTAVGETSAHLSALVIAHSSPTVVSFEYGRDASYGSGTPPSPIGSDTLAHTSGADITGLAPGTTYHIRAVANNGIGTTIGPDLAFTTQSPPVHEEEKKPPKCRKGKVRRHGKCVKRHRRTHRKHSGGRRNG
jgi:hypothetical protein